MRIELEIDYIGKPYLNLYAEGNDLRAKTLKRFIRIANEKGIIAKTCSVASVDGKSCDLHLEIHYK